ncbi:MAG: radical SAM protein [Erysipelotrichaceae bacterium]|nr:radical SAM protein [Erysipelotrichaceae bacterium]
MKRVYLEITNACNLNCPFCTYEKGNSFLSLKEIQDCLSQIKPICDYIYLHILGEPLLHPDFEKIMDLLDGYGLKLQLVSNGTLLYRYPGILEHRALRKLSISLHSINNIDVDDRYFQTIDKLIENNDKVIELRFYDRDNLDNKLRSYLLDLEERFGCADTKRKNSYKLKDNLYVYFEKMFRWPDINDPVISKNGTCHGAIDMIAINSDLDVTICCLDPKAHNRIGSLRKDKLKDILGSKEYLECIESFKNHQLRFELCRKCSYRLRFK